MNVFLIFYFFLMLRVYLVYILFRTFMNMTEIIYFNQT